MPSVMNFGEEIDFSPMNGIGATLRLLIKNVGRIATIAGNCADERCASDRVDVFGRSLAWTNPAEPLYSHVLGHVIRIGDDGRVEVAEENDADDVEQIVQRHAWRDLLDWPSEKAQTAAFLNERRQCRRERQNGRAKITDDAARVHLGGNGCSIRRIYAARRRASRIAP